MFDFFYKRPYLLYSVIVAFFVLGIIGFINLPKNLFPDANPPKVVVVTKLPGATAKVIANSVSKPIEEEVSKLSNVNDVSSINVANFSIVAVEFNYKKDLNSASTDVANAINIAKAKLPKNANPAIYLTGDFTLPVEVISLSPKNNSITLADIRKIAENFIKPYLLSKKDIGNVEVFGGYKPAINIKVDPFKAKKYNIKIDNIIKAIGAIYKDMPVGFIKGDNSFYTISFYGQKSNIEKLKNLLISPNVRLKDIADVEFSYEKNLSAYIGNSKDAIALSIQRAPGGSVLDVSDTARAEIKKLQKEYPNINFEISDTQRDLITQANENMIEALRDAIIFTLLVIMIFLGNFRAIIAAGLSIPMVFFSTIAIIWLMGGELNIIVYTAIILALGLLTDDAVVVLENIERHLIKNHEDLDVAIEHGTKEVLGAVFAGTIATSAVLFPLMFVGGYPQEIFRPLIETLIIALFVSWFLSITFIPNLSKWLYKNGAKKTKIEQFFESLYQNTIGRLVKPYIGILEFSNGKFKIIRRVFLTLFVIAILLFSVKNVLPTIGRDAMPPMDTGIIKANVAFSSNETVENVKEKIKPFLNWLHSQKWVRMSSVTFGGEGGVLSLGNGNLPTEATITINAVNRFQRDKTIWELEDIIRDKLAKIPGVIKDDVFDFGATAVSSIKANIDLRVYSPNLEGLTQNSKKVEAILKDIPGITSINRSWSKDFSEIVLDIDTNKALSYGLTPYSIVMQLPLKGQVVGLSTNFSSMNGVPIRLYLKDEYANNINSLKLFPLSTKFGDIPLSAVAKIKHHLTYAKIERDNMLYAIDVYGYRAKRPITHLVDDIDKKLQNPEFKNINIQHTGDIALMNDSFTRMAKAIAIGVVLLIIILIAIYHSVKLALVMIIVLPLSVIGAAWGMLLFDKPSCLPGMLGILLLFSIIIKNAVLLVDFYGEFRKKENSFNSAKEAIKVRFRPVMMTAFGTIAGMIPIALEKAVGLERLSPLADVAIGGLLIGTFLTLVYIPMYAYVFNKD